MLLQQEEIQLNAANVQCENATALHTAVMHGKAETVFIVIFGAFMSTTVVSFFQVM